MKKKALFIFGVIFLMAFSTTAQIATCELYAITDIAIDTSGSTNKMEITISSNDFNINHLNYTYIDFVLNSTNDTIAQSNFFNFYAHPSGQTSLYKVPTSLSVLPANFNYSVSLAYRDLFSSNDGDTSCILSFSQTTTSLNNSVLEREELNIYPNPVQQNQSIIINFNAQEYHNPNLFIYDMNGKMIIKKLNINTNEVEVNTSNFPKGIYYVQLMEKNGAYQLGKIVIQ